MKVQSTQHFEIFSLFRTIPPALRATSLYTREALIFAKPPKIGLLTQSTASDSGAVDFMFACFAPKSGFFALFFLRFVVRLYRGGYLLVVIEDIDNDRNRDENHSDKRRVAHSRARCGSRAVRALAEQ